MAVEATSTLTKVSERVLYEWVSEKEKAGRVLTPKKRSGARGHQRKKELDDFDLGVLRRVVHSFFRRNEIPTVAKLMRHIDGDSEMPSVSTATMHRMLKKLGFRYKKRSRNALLIEATLIVQSHHHYLRQIAELRCQGRQIFYTDETWVNAGHTSSQVWVDETVGTQHKARQGELATGLQNTRDKKGRLIVTHCDNESGFVEEVFRANQSSGDYHEEMNGAHYERCFAEKLLPLLPPGSVIVMDNAAYDSVKQLSCRE
ncbi:hypothetical protein HPB49_016011 [Dermacentor silvarum]|uniref:Uncharacterized protein n=1 Tax=Dermacentor silvarum TaxID=543639 RepID=A0ACB8CLV4_DERSI|nr:hypothetical protein HPB49_016011 [Dermacentor silvarum]